MSAGAALSSALPGASPTRRRAPAVGMIAALLGCTPAAAQSVSNGQDFAQIERGRYLTVAADCAACHTDPNQKQPFAGGRPIETPFGVVISPNITPDLDTGIGAWSDDDFEAALRRGITPDGTRLYPAMPYLYYTKMPHADVLAIRAYLNTLAPVHNEVVTNQLPFPFNIRAGMRFWDALYFTAGEYKPDPSQSAAWNRGAYLVQGPGHCGACHTPKTTLGGDKSAQALRGYSIQGWFAPNITNDERRGIAGWSVGDLVDYLKKGHNRFAAASGPMAEEVSDSSSRMSQADLEAMATYLKNLQGVKGEATPLAVNDPMMVAGAAIYDDLCSACHKPDGTGIPYFIPNLAASNSVASREPTTLIRVVLEGAQSVATNEEPTAPAMPSFGWQLTDAQVAAVTTYVSNSWHHAAGAITERQVQEARESLGPDRD
jgi:mono/diheme cytochrome c family protein